MSIDRIYTGTRNVYLVCVVTQVHTTNMVNLFQVIGKWTTRCEPLLLSTHYREESGGQQQQQQPKQKRKQIDAKDRDTEQK